MKIKIGILLLTCLHLQCNSQPVVKNKELKVLTEDNSIYGRIVIINNPLVMASSNNHFYFQRRDFSVNNILVMLNEDTTRISIDYSIWLKRADTTQVPFYLTPGDTVYSKLNSNGLITLYSKTNNKQNNELQFFEIENAETGSIFNYFISRSNKYFIRNIKNENDFIRVENTTNKKMNERLQILNHYKDKLNKNFYNKCKNLIECTRIYDLNYMLSLNRKAFKNNSFISKIIKQYGVDSLIKIGYDENFMCEWALKSTVNVATIGFIDSHISNSQILINKFNFINANFRGEQKDYLLSYFLFSALGENAKISEKAIEIFNKNCNSSFYKKVITDKITEQQAEKNNKINGDAELMEYGNNKQLSISNLSAKHKGKLIYIDVWASWCTPCLEEIPYLKKIEKEYSQKNIAFISISEDKNKRAWETACKEKQTINYENYILINPESSKFLKDNNIQSIPRFILIGKNGKIINPNAPRPSDPKLKELIDKYLKE